jgi:AraC-like DNA-binding protein
MNRKTVPDILLKFAHLLGTEVINNRLEIPEGCGSGYCKGYVFNAHIRMLISNYELREDFIVENPGTDSTKRMLFFKFQNIFPKAQNIPTVGHLGGAPSVLIGTSRMNTDELIAIHTNTAVINLEVDADYLKDLFEMPERSSVLQSLLKNTEPLLFEQAVYPSLQQIVNHIVTEPVSETFQLFFLKIKAEELICRLLIELEKRDEKQLYPLNSHDLQTIYKIKAQMLDHLDVPPVIEELAAAAGMSATKLKRLFRQIFGSSIFNYYQQFRMHEAARLLKEEKRSVSETGYRLGFVNLSHFSRVFFEHIGMKPKQYSRS